MKKIGILIYFISLAVLWRPAFAKDSAKDIAGKFLQQKDYTKAITWYKEALKGDPADEEIYVHLGEAYWELGNYEIAFNWYKVCNKAEEKLNAAEKIFWENIKVDPKNIFNYLGLSWVSSKRGKVAESISWLKRGMRVFPDDSNIYSSLGWIYLKQKDYPQAIIWFKKAIEINPHDVKTYEGISWVYVEKSDYKEALRWLNEAKKICLECKRIDEIMGRVYTSMGEFDKAESILREIVSSIDDDYGYWGCPFQALGELYSHMTISDKSKKVIESYIGSAEKEGYRDYVQFETAKVCYDYGDYGHALKYIDRAIKLAHRPQLRNDYLILKGYIMISLRKYTDAEGIFNEVVSGGSKEQRLRARVGLGHIEITRNNYKLAHEYFQGMLKADSLDIMASLGMGWLCANQGENQKALFFFEKVIKQNKDNMFALSGKGFALIGVGRLQEAKVLFEEAVKLYPQDEYLLNGLAITNYHLGDIAASEKDFKVALKQNPETFTCPYEGLGMIYLKQGKIREAEENFKKAIEINPNIEYKKYNGLARIYIKQGKIKEAKDLLNRSIQNYHYDNEAKDMLRSIEKK